MIELIVSNWRMLILGISLGVSYITYDMYHREHNAFQEYKQRVVAEREASTKAAEVQNAQHQANLDQLKADYEQKIAAVRDAAMRNYLNRFGMRRQPTSSTGHMPGIAPGKQVDDGAVSQCLPDEEFIRAAAESELKLMQWQDYGKRNNLPIQ